MRKDFNDYNLYVFDVDGTLYDQPRLRILMAAKLFVYFLVRPHRFKELLCLMKFRRCKDEWDTKGSDLTPFVKSSKLMDELDERVCRFVADEIKLDADTAIRVIEKWIYIVPNEILYKVRDTNLIERINELKDEQKKVVVFSDYPAEEKLKALGVFVDAVYSSGSKIIGEFKPSPKGLNVIMSDFNVSCSEVLMVGDRMEKDGMAAQNAGCDYLILNRHINKRDKREYE